MYKHVYTGKTNYDANHKEIVTALKKAGCSVLNLAAVGGGCPDILVGFDTGKDTLNILMEIKSENGRLRPDQKKFIESWNGKTAVVRSAREAVYIVDKYKSLAAE